MTPEPPTKPGLWRRLRDQYRKRFGRYALEDPRPIKRAAPYTFHLPPADDLAAVQVGDLVKLMIRSVPRSLDYSAERMWVVVLSIDGDDMTGRLDNTPFDIPPAAAGLIHRFSTPPHHRHPQTRPTHERGGRGL